MKYEITHTNTFYYEASAEQSLNTCRLKPRNDEFQRVFLFQKEINPVTMTNEYVDIWGNHVESFFIPEKHQVLEVKTKSIVSVQKASFLPFVSFTPEMEQIWHSSLFYEHYLPFLKTTSHTYLHPEQIDEVNRAIGTGNNPMKFALELMHFLFQEFTYDPGATNVGTTAAEAFVRKRGVCQDYTHVMITILRSRGIPARYVSGYLYVGEDSQMVGNHASHAWVEMMVPGIGWVGLDPTNNVEALMNHIKLCVGRDYTDVSPLQGVYNGSQHKLDVKVAVNLL
ncbi:MAG: transglutaminase domain-containing protein [Bacillus sp. (in: firmicutes)]